MAKIDDKYDVVIIGAGIGGLVCGCYLAKAGMKVLIVEKNNKPGGYCSSLNVNDFIFDISALQSCREDNEFGKIIRELGIDEKVEIKRVDPPYVIVTPDVKIGIKNDINETIMTLQEEFPQEASNIRGFFNFIRTTSFSSLFLRWKNKTFKDLLDQYLKDSRLKTVMMVLLGQAGVSPLKISSLTGVFYLRNLIFDGGYFTKGGLKTFADAFVSRFKEAGGEIVFSHLVEKIEIKNKRAIGINFQKGNFILNKYVVSNCDATQTFLRLVGEDNLNAGFVNRLKKLIPSVSAFIVYLGINKDLKDTVEHCQELWYCPNSNIDNPWDPKRLEGESFGGHIYCYFYSFKDPTLAPAGNESISIGIMVPHLDKEYWYKNKEWLADKLIKEIEKTLIPQLSNFIIKKLIITPLSLEGYSLNRNGAMRGWAPFPTQIDRSIMPQETPIERLYLAGHWVTMPFGESGLPMAAYVGRRVARLILKSAKNDRFLEEKA